MNGLNIQSCTTKSFKPTTPQGARVSRRLSENVLDQDFPANAPNEKWVSDMTPRVTKC